MTFEIEINGRLRHVSVESGGPSRQPFPRDRRRPRARRRRRGRRGGYAVARPAGGRRSQPRGRLLRGAAARRGDRLHAPRHAPRRRERTAVAAGRRRPPLRASSGSSRRCRARSSACSSTPGDEVTARQPLVVVEAMKMENELTSPKAGRVKDVAVKEGVSPWRRDGCWSSSSSVTTAPEIPPAGPGTEGSGAPPRRDVPGRRRLRPARRRFGRLRTSRAARPWSSPPSSSASWSVRPDGRLGPHAPRPRRTPGGSADRTAAPHRPPLHRTCCAAASRSTTSSSRG